MKLSLDLANQNVVRKDGTVWKSISTWVKGGSGNENYYDVSSCGDYWSNAEHYETVEVFKTVTCYAKFKFTNITLKYCPLIQVKVSSSTIDRNPSVAISNDGSLIINDKTYNGIVNYTNSFVEVIITFNNGVATTRVKINDYEYVDFYTYSNVFTKVLAQIGSKASAAYALPVSTYLYDFYLTDEDVSTEDPTPTPTGSKFLDTNGLTKVWEQIGKKYYSKEEINTKLSNAGISSSTSIINMDNYVDLTDTINNSLDGSIIGGYYVADWEPSQDGWLSLNVDNASCRILVDCILSDTVYIRLFDLNSSYICFTVPIQKNKKYRITTNRGAFTHVVFMPNITSSIGDNNEIITANNILFSLPTPTSLVEDEEGTVYTLTDRTVLGG